MSEMLKRVARDLRFVMYGVPLQRPLDDDSSWLIYAKTVVQSMREPTSEMIDAGSEVDDAGGDFSIGETAATNTYRAMISAALKD